MDKRNNHPIISYFSKRAKDGSYADLYSPGVLSRENHSFIARKRRALFFCPK